MTDTGTTSSPRTWPEQPEPYYQDDLVTLYHGDCQQVAAWLTADVLVTDPPYGIDYAAGSMHTDYRPAQRGVIPGDKTLAVRDAALDLWGDRPAIVFGMWSQPRPAGTRHRLIWHKRRAKPGLRTAPWFSADEEVYVLGRGFVGIPTGSVYATDETRDGAAGQVARIGHPTPKPIALMVQLLQKCPPGLIADPFSGSGSTLVAAKHLGRRAVGIEIEERYCEIAARRLAQDVLDFGEAS